MAGNINPNPFTTRPEIDGTFGVVTSTHWIATAVGMGMLEKGGNAFDAAVRDRVHAAGGRAASQRPGRRRAGHRARRAQAARPRSSAARGRRRPAPPSRITRALGLDMVPGTGLLAACVPGTFETWMLLLRDYGTMRARRRAGARDLLCAERPSAGRARQRHHRDGRGAVPRALADLGGGLSAGRQGAAARHAVHQPDAGRRPTRASCKRPKAPAAIASRRSSARARSGRRASSPKRSTGSAARRR